MLSNLVRANTSKAIGLFRTSRLNSTDSSGDKFKGVEGPKEHSCGIPPWKVEHIIPPPPPPPEFPAHLIRPPCIPGSKPGGYQTCVEGTEGYYCIPCRLRYKYPSFSENIDFVPPFMTEPPCWWKMQPTCFAPGEEADRVLEDLTRRWPCNYEF